LFLQTIGQAILSRELRLDSTDPSDIMRLHSLGIHKEQARIGVIRKFCDHVFVF
ncbi:unnamed protein product, partial [Rotaria sp. Silwood1]